MLDPQYGLVTYGLRLVGLPAGELAGQPVGRAVDAGAGHGVEDHRLPAGDLPGRAPGDPGRLLRGGGAGRGGTGWKRFRFITWPLLSPTTLFLVVTLTIASFQGFDIVKIMTQGGPITSTMIYVYYIYEQAFQYFRLGKASAAVVVFFALILLLTLAAVARVPPARAVHHVSHPNPLVRCADRRWGSWSSPRWRWARTSGWSRPRSRTCRA